MKNLRIVVSLPNDNAYQHEQGAAAQSAAKRLGLDLEVIRANNDSITQSQQLLNMIHAPSEKRPAAFLVEPVTATGLRRVAEAAVGAGIAWVISNSDVDYVRQLRKSPLIPVFTVTQGQNQIGQVQGKQLAALLPQGGSVLFVEGPSMSSVAVQRREGMESVKPAAIQLTKIRSQWGEESAFQSTNKWLELATSRAERFHLVAGQTHELALGARRAFQGRDTAEQQRGWMRLPFIGIGVSPQVKPLVTGRVLAAAVVTSVTMDLALKLLLNAMEAKVQPPERTIVEVSSFPDLEKLEPIR